MTDETEVAQEATEEVVQSSDAPETEESTEAPEAAESTEGQEETPPADGEPEGEDKPEEKSQSKLRRERRKAEQARLRQEAAEAKAAAEKAQADMAKIAEAAQSTQPPKESDFDDYNQYLVAMGAFQARRMSLEDKRGEVEERATQADQQAQMIEQQRRAEMSATWAEQRADARARYADFDTVVNDNVPISSDMAEMIVQSDAGADVAYHLGSNPELATTLARLSPIEQAREFGRLEATLSFPQPKTKSSAPDPITPVKPSSNPRKGLQGMSQADYRRAREKELRNG